MNIKEAKEQISNAMRAYFTKDEFGNYMIPIEQQRPVFLMGPPGIGKTAIMAQIANELNVGLVSYSMTHHTRQSALGLPFIVRKNYGGREYDVSEYTMSEIIASVYDMMEETGQKEGILFLDEINCVSETLAPVMLQFLQYKIFGRHRVPDGWIVVTAGNPPEYNNSVREFDIVTWDRLKRMDIEPDYDVWKEFAIQKGTHPAITTYLDIKKQDFYKIETTVDGKSFVTARGWSDLSDMIKLYEKNDLKVDEKLVGQYLQNRKIAKDFSIYYDLFRKYRSDYQIDTILAGKASDEIKSRAKKAKFDERTALLGLILDGIYGETRDVYLTESSLKETVQSLGMIRNDIAMRKDAADSIEKQADQKRTTLANGIKASNLSDDDRYILNSSIAMLESVKKSLVQERPSGENDEFKLIKGIYDGRVKEFKKESKAVKDRMNNAFAFLEEVFPDGQEMLIFVTELTISFYSSRFISRYGCEKYFEHNKELLFYERQKEIINELDDLEL